MNGKNKEKKYYLYLGISLIDNFIILIQGQI